MEQIYDVIVVGAGPGGLTAALYALRASKSVLLLEKAAFGGQMTYSPKIENYPGTASASGAEIADAMVSQVLDFGAEVELDEIKSAEKEGDAFILHGAMADYRGRSVILATGAKHRQLGLPKENELTGEGVSYCAVCDGDFYRDKTIAVIGGGNSAVGDALMLSDKCKHITVVQNLPDLTGERSLCEKLRAKENVEVICNYTVEELLGEKALSGIKIKHTETGEISTLSPLDGIFIAVGHEPQNGAFASVVALDDYGYIIAGEDCKTSCEGIFAAGDCRTKKVRQVTTACGDGTCAALGACEYLRRFE